MTRRLDDMRTTRREKLAKLRALGIDPYPSDPHRTHTNAEALASSARLADATITIVGRIRSMRTMGSIIFAHVEDGTAKIQVLFKREELSAAFNQLALYDLGDFVECTGTMFLTKTQEKTLAVSSFRMLAKTLRPLPTEHFGLEDEEMRLRKRYLDVLLHPDVKALFIKKNAFWSSMRSFLAQKGFLEVDMPVLENVPGGAEAEPFVTHHNALEKDFFLRISLELPLKKMLVAGYERVFEIGRIFRNEGIDAEHLQDYTQMECYWAYASFDDLLAFVRTLYQHVIEQTFGTLQLSYRGTAVDWSGEWPVQDYHALFSRYTKLDLQAASDDDLRAYAAQHNLHVEPTARRGRLIDQIFKKQIRPLPEVSMQPSFLVNQPVEIEPLAKRDPKNPHAVQRLQVLACGSELGKGFAELNDPLDQRARFEEQMRLREAGDAEAQRLDEEYLEAMEYGMPPAAGFGVSERLFAVLSGKPVRETVVFPPMKGER